MLYLYAVTEMARLLIVRHAKTEWNVTGRIQGRSDVPLTEESRLAAAELGRSLAGERIDAAYCSPLSRARETARLILGGRMEPVCDDRLVERDFGELEGRTYDELGLADHTRLFYALPDAKGAESDGQVFARVRSFVRDISARHKGQTVLVVSHGVCISYLMYALSHDSWDPSSYEMNYIKNLTVTEAETDL